MQIDASIPLAVKAPEPIDPLGDYSKVLSIGHMIQQRGINAEQLKAEQLQNQTRQRSLDADKTLAGLVSQHTQVGDDGVPVTNHGAIISGLSNAGYGAQALKYDADRRADERAQLTSQKDKIGVLKERVGMIGQMIGPIVKAASPDYTNLDEDGQPAPPAAPQQVDALYRNALGRAIQGGLLKPGEMPDSVLGKDGTVNPDVMGMLKSHMEAASTAEQQIAQHDRDLDYGLRLNQFNETVRTNAPKTQEAWLSHASQLFGAADDQSHWNAARHNLQEAGAPAGILNMFGQAWSPEAQDKAGTLGMTSEQRESNQARRDAADAMKDYRDESLRLRDEMLTLHREATARERGQTENSKAVDRRNAIGLINKHELDEKKLNREILQLGQALTNGNLYVPPNGTPKAMAAAISSGEAGETKDALMGDMLARYRAAQDDLKRTIADKYNEYGRLGVNPTIPIDKVHGAIDAGASGLDKVLRKRYPNASWLPAAEAPPATPAQPQAAAAPAPAALAAQAPAAQTPQRLRNAAGHVIVFSPQKNAWVDEKTGEVVK